MTENDNAVEAMVYKGQHAAKQRCEGFHRSSPVGLCLNKIIGQTAGSGISGCAASSKFQICLGSFRIEVYYELEFIPSSRCHRRGDKPHPGPVPPMPHAPAYSLMPRRSRCSESASSAFPAMLSD